MKQAKTIFLSGILFSLLLVALISYSGQLGYRYYQSLDISGSDITSWVTDCRDKRKFLGIFEVTDVDFWCGDAPYEEPEGNGPDGAMIDSEKESGGTPKERIQDLSPSYGNPQSNESNEISYLPYIIPGLLLLLGWFLWKRRRPSNKQNKEDDLEFDDYSVVTSDSSSEHENRVHYRVPDSAIRQQLIQFERTLPPQKRRRPYETLSTWAKRIELDASLLTYLETRYDDGNISPQREEAFTQQLDEYLLRIQKESNS
ncbi:conserved hypothetical protein [Exiguobacterium sp. 8H]|uniref:hypothetical protein n=1 Tax=unclassified Exiguobacterium TaxID=2644629 RepID=UPI0012F21B18|nr:MULTISPECIES: hypothetical protein [unclassified Exiguobacterium]VXB20481.1 conserved hypothetical protein [Exiguobacterium sp. 8H]VXB21257.1 conserved hypothetical protein [Exiguobacterium sp. 8A]